MTDDQILDALLAKEGGYVDHPADTGGPTNFGITQATLSAWMSRPVTVDEVKRLTIDVARDIYRSIYLQPFELLDGTLKPQVVDIAVNSGVGQARTLLARAEESCRQTQRPLTVQLVIERLEFYAKIVKARPSQSVFLVGWIRRAVSFLVCVLVVSSACAARTEPPLVIWFRNAPQDWTPPDQFSDCCVRDEVVLENGRRPGQQAIRLECLHKTVFLDKVTKRVVWVQQWP